MRRPTPASPTPTLEARVPEQYQNAGAAVPLSPAKTILMLWECLTCYAVVQDMAGHNEWHQQERQPDA